MLIIGARRFRRAFRRQSLLLAFLEHVGEVARLLELFLARGTFDLP